MLEHGFALPQMPARLVVLGAGGFVGKACADHCARNGMNVLRLGRADIDLTQRGSGAVLAARLKSDDVLLVVSAIAPCKTPRMLADNVAMMAEVCDALAARPVAHVIYVSSDAVYPDEPVPLTEAVPARPTTLHGAMHRTREMMLAESAGSAPYAILRPTLLYGQADPHNGYGPNRFRRLSAAGEPIVLFGEGEEKRDHVLIDDLAELAKRVVLNRSRGVLNIASGAVASFSEIAEMVVAIEGRPVDIRATPRQGPMPHNGYRPFDIGVCRGAFPDFRYTPLKNGLERARRPMEQAA